VLVITTLKYLSHIDGITEIIHLPSDCRIFSLWTHAELTQEVYLSLNVKFFLQKLRKFYLLTNFFATNNRKMYRIDDVQNANKHFWRCVRQFSISIRKLCIIIKLKITVPTMFVYILQIFYCNIAHCQCLALALPI
jgi:hypothetical protein